MPDAIRIALAASLVVLAGCSGAKLGPVYTATPVAPADAAKIEALLNEGKGKVVVFNFWATWCPPCVEEMPYFSQFYRKADPSRVHFISLSADAEESLDDTLRIFQHKQELPFPVYYLKDSIEAVSKALRTELSGALPATLVYDRNGALAKSWEGGITLADLERAVNPLLK